MGENIFYDSLSKRKSKHRKKQFFVFTVYFFLCLATILLCLSFVTQKNYEGMKFIIATDLSDIKLKQGANEFGIQGEEYAKKELEDNYNDIKSDEYYSSYMNETNGRIFTNTGESTPTITEKNYEFPNTSAENDSESKNNTTGTDTAQDTTVDGAIVFGDVNLNANNSSDAINSVLNIAEYVIDDTSASEKVDTTVNNRPKTLTHSMDQSLQNTTESIDAYINVSKDVTASSTGTIEALAPIAQNESLVTDEIPLEIKIKVVEPENVTTQNLLDQSRAQNISAVHEISQETNDTSSPMIDYSPEKLNNPTAQTTSVSQDQLSQKATESTTDVFDATSIVKSLEDIVADSYVQIFEDIAKQSASEDAVGFVDTMTEAVQEYPELNLMDIQEN